ncbi:MAG: heat-inducible transcriptional repressor HrcA [Gammaproteobacteria bacterium]|nr:heat-inducible transcriptional repressor HrcA [Gammaproteobacteria bacterium]
MSKTSIPLVLNERAQHLLKVLVQRYIRDGQPVGSRTLSRDSGLSLSPATIRNVMADLEELGLIRSPHTSAGRVPTGHGMRFFVESLLKVKPLEGKKAEHLRNQIEPELEVRELIANTSTLLSRLTHLAGVVTLPRRERLKLRQVEFLPLSEQRVLVILVINDSEVQNRVIHTYRQYTPDELIQAANYLNSLFSGKELYDVRSQLLREMRATRESMNRMMEAAIEMADKAFVTDSDQDDYVLMGETNLMGIAELGEPEKLRQLFEAFTEKRQILHLLDGALHAEGIQIFIGEESGYRVLDDCSLVTAPYEFDGEVVGALGVIGPTRMAYDRVIPIVDLTAKLFGSALNHNN